MSMFKKLKDKIEEVTQSPLKLTTSMQQLTNAISSSPLGGSSTDLDKTWNESPIKKPEMKQHTEDNFTTINLSKSAGSGQGRTRKLSSNSSITELFPIFEFPHSQDTSQPDLESVSEYDDTNSIQVDYVTKENLYGSYRKMQQKYSKYKGRYADLLKYYKELEHENAKAKHILTETQDKALRRIMELKEQCNLEQKAKAHLEETLRADLEERDHIINTLNTKIGWLKNSKDNENQADATLSTVSNTINSNNNNEIENLRDKLKHYETLLSKAKDAILSKNQKLEAMQAAVDDEKRKREDDIEYYKKRLMTCEEKAKELQDTIDDIRAREEEETLRLAENKLQIHKELEEKEAQIKKLQENLAQLMQQGQTSLACDMETQIEQIHTFPSNETEVKYVFRNSEENIDLIQMIDKLRIDLEDQKPLVEDLGARLKISEEKLVASKTMKKEHENQIKQLETQVSSLLHQLTNLEKSKIETDKNLEIAIVAKNNLFDELYKKNAKINYLNEIIKKWEILLQKFFEKFDKSKIEDQNTSDVQCSFENAEINLSPKTDDVPFDKNKHEVLNSPESFEISSENQENSLKMYSSKLLNIAQKILDSEQKIKDYEDLQMRHNELNKKIVSYESKCADSDKKFKLLTEELKLISVKNENLVRQLTTNEARIEQLTREYESKFKIAVQNVTQAKMEMFLFRDEIKRVIQTFSEDYDEIKSIASNTISKLSASLEQREKIITNLKKRNTDLCNENENLGKKLREILQISECEKAKNESIILKLRKNIEDITCKHQTELNKVNSERLHLSAKIETYENTISQLENTVSELQNIIDTQSDEASPYDTETEDKFKMNSYKESLSFLIKDISNIKKSYYLLKNDYTTNIDSVETLLENFKHKTEDIVQNISLSMQKEINDFSNLRLTNETLERENRSLKNNEKDLTRSIEDLQKSINDLKNKCNLNDEKESKLQTKIETIEEEYENRIKQIIIDFETQLERKNQEYDNLKHDFRDRQNQEVNKECLELNHIIRNLTEDLSTKNNAFEKLVEEYKILKQASISDKELLVAGHAEQIKEVEMRWKDRLREVLNETENAYKEEVNELTQEWSIERKELEQAVNDPTAETSNMIQLLRKQITTLSEELTESKKLHKKEVNDLRRMLKIPNDNEYIPEPDLTSLEDCMEMEYLRNILYQYMMGKEPLVLAKVISAIVKFDEDQIRNIIDKEEQKQSLFSHISLS